MNKSKILSVFNVKGTIYKVAATGQKALSALRKVLPHYYTETTLNFYVKPILTGFEIAGEFIPVDVRPHWEVSDELRISKKAKKDSKKS